MDLKTGYSIDRKMTGGRLRYKAQFLILGICILTILLILRKIYNVDHILNSTESARYESGIIIPSILTAANRKSFRDDDVRYRTLAEKNSKDIPVLEERLVHLDLKGAPPRIGYFEELFPFMKRLGATGILIEYEDMFPYHDILDDITSYNAYTKVDINEIVRLAEENNLMVIPLVQTFGHMEFILKLRKFKELREVPEYPQVICPTHNKTIPLIYTMIDQIVSYHPNIKYLHVGSDEVYHLGQCSRCVAAITENNWSKRQLFLNHTYQVAKYVRDKYKIIPIMWDDEFRTASVEEIKQSNIADIIEIMIWKYTPDVRSYITDDLMDKYSLLFNNIWIASSFKGSTGPDRYITDVSHHYLNHRAWLELVASWHNKINFRGIAITGWQRYDHFAVLCELLPVGIPSLAVSLLIIQSSKREISSISDKMLDIIKCEVQYVMTPSDLVYLQLSGNRCQFPGASLYYSIIQLYTLSSEIDRCIHYSSVLGWMSPYNVKYSFSNPSIVESATSDFDRLKSDMDLIKSDIKNAMSDIYDTYTITEWMESFVTPLSSKLNKLIADRDKILEKREWPRRPLGIKTDSKT